MKNDLLKKIKRILMVEAGTFIFAMAIGLFILPGKILSGGVAGITALLSNFIAFPEDLMAIVINIILFLLGSVFLGKGFFFNTLVFSVSYPFWLLLVTRFFPSYEIDPILAAVYGGIIGGIGIGLMFRNGGSSGGTDAIALIAEKYFHVKVSMAVMMMDVVTVLAGLFIYGLNAVLIGLISVFLMSFALERTMEIYGGVEAKKFEIISDKYQEISRDILEIVERGTTLLDITGGFTGDAKKMLVVVVSDDQYSQVKSIVDKHDPKAFVIISQTKDVNGEGFTFEPRM